MKVNRIPCSNYQVPEWLARRGRICSLSRRSWVRLTHYAVAASMRVTLKIIGFVLLTFGSIWVLQGIGVLAGSFMTGRFGGQSMAGIAMVALRDR